MKLEVLFIMVILVISCGKLSDKVKESQDTIVSSVSNDASNIILYNNAFVAYINEADIKINRTANEYEKMYKMVTYKEKPLVYNGLAFIGSDPILKDVSNDISILEPDNYIPENARHRLKEAVKNTYKAYNNTKDAYTILKSYVKNEDFKNDDWLKGKELTETIKENISKYYENQDLAVQTLKPIADEAEENLLEDDPLKESILASKLDLNLAKEIVVLVYAERLGIDKLNTKYDELESNYLKHKNLTPNLLKTNNKTRSYKYFYNELEKFLGEVRKCKRDGKIDNDEADDINDGYQTLIRSYNKSN